MANGFDNTDPLQLDTSSNGVSSSIYPDTQQIIDQISMTPEEIAKQEEGKRAKTLEYVEAYRNFGLREDLISQKIGSFDGYDKAEVKAIMWSQYEIDRKKELEAHESKLKEHEENVAAKELRMQQLENSLKKKDITFEQDGEPLPSGLDLVGEAEEGKELQELSEDERFDSYFNKYTTPQGVETADHIRLAGVNDSLAKDARHISYSEALLRHLSDGNLEDVEEALHYMEQDGVDIVGDYDLENPEDVETIEEKMDSVGKEDGDIDNDGDKDSSDKYLAKRRAAIGKAMKAKAK